jgi:hypothetical protein
MKKLLLVKGSAGLADRLYQLLTAVMYAKISNRQIVVDWRDECFGNTKRENLFSIAFDFQNIDAGTMESIPCNVLSVCPPPWRGKLNLTAHEIVQANGLYIPWSSEKIIKECSVDIASCEHVEDVAVYMIEKNMEKMRESINSLFPCFVNRCQNEIRKELFVDHLVLNPDILQEVQELCDTYCLDEVIGVHVRKTNESGMRTFGIHLYFKAIDRIRRQCPEADIYLATDNAEVISAFKAKYGRIIAIDKWLPKVGLPLHRGGAPDHRRNFKDAVVEMLILSRCSWLVIPGVSGFSNFASMMSEIPSERIVSIHAQYCRQIGIRMMKRLRRAFS